MKHLLLPIFFVFACTGLFGQNPSGVLPKNNYPKGKITLLDKQVFDIKDISVEGDSLAFVYGFNDLKRKIHFSQVEEIRVLKGTKIVSGAIYGTVIPLLFIMESLLDNEPNADNAGLLTAGVLAGGAAIGALIGYSIPVWKTYHIGSSKKSGISMQYNLQLNSKMIAARLVIGFSPALSDMPPTKKYRSKGFW